MIDFVLMRASQRVHCRDVRVMRGANCWTDHRLVRAKINIVISRFRSGGVTSCIPFAVHELAMSEKRDEYCKVLEQYLHQIYIPALQSEGSPSKCSTFPGI